MIKTVTYRPGQCEVVITPPPPPPPKTSIVTIRGWMSPCGKVRWSRAGSVHETSMSRSGWVLLNLDVHAVAPFPTVTTEAEG